MKRDATGPALSAIFVDYDNIYLSLKRKNEDAAKRFSKDAALWIKELETGRLITTTNGYEQAGLRRVVMNRCYGNPMPRRNSHDNSTDMNSFPFVRHHFLRAGSEVIDCPPLTAQMKNSADIRMVMDIRDMLTHDTYFDEFIILSGDADFTPLLHRLRAHARRTIIFANDHTASPYTAISDGEVRESTLMQLLLDGRIGGAEPAVAADGELAQLVRPQSDLSGLRREIIAEIITLVRGAGQPVPMEALADRALRQLGHEKTAGSGWGGLGSFRDLLASYLPQDFRISEQAPFVVFEVARMLPVDAPKLEASRPAPRQETHVGGLVRNSRLDSQPDAPRSQIPSEPIHQDLRSETLPRPEMQRLERTPQTAQGPASIPHAPLTQALMPHAPLQERTLLSPATKPPEHQAQTASLTTLQQQTPIQRQSAPQAMLPTSQATQPRPTNLPRAPAQPSAISIQQTVARIYEACQAPPLSPPEYRVLFDVMAQEISTRGLTGAPTLDNIAAAAKALGVEIHRNDVRFVLEVVSEADPWFEQGASANLFASRFRNFVVARCRSHGLTLSADELDLIEHWFTGAAAPQPAAQLAPIPQAPIAPAVAPVPQQQGSSHAGTDEQWWSVDQGKNGDQLGTSEDFPRIIRTRIRG